MKISLGKPEPGIVKHVNILVNEKLSRHYARLFLAEDSILEWCCPVSCYWYAAQVMRHRWPEAEPAIAQDAFWAYYYARYVIQARFPEAEQVISKSVSYAWRYAVDVMGERWPEVEEKIINNHACLCTYLVYFPEAKKDLLK